MPRTSPPNWRKDVVLKDGTTLRLRPIRPEDDERMLALFGRLSPQTIYRRFFTLLQHMSLERIRQFTHIDYDHQMALVGVMEDPEEPGGERIIAVGRYVRLPRPQHAEVAFTVEDAYQGLGIGTHLLQELLPFALRSDIEVLEAEILGDNRRMLDVFRNMGFTIRSTRSEGVVHVEFPFHETEEVQERRWARERAAYVAAIERLFRPRSVAVIGASNTHGTIGHALVRNLVLHDFSGPVYPINPKHKVVHAIPCLPTIQDVPGEVDMAIVVVPAHEVPDVVRECATKRVYALVILSAGFAETGPEGKALQDEVLDLARRYGIRLVGPNCLGLLNTENGIRLDATFAPVFPPAGAVAMGSQSGALGIAILNLARDLRLGISQFIGLGNKADISGNDLLHFWGKDPATRVILLYLESFGNPRKFSRIARSVGREKPIVVLKSGNSQAGARAATSHTGAPAAPKEMVEQLLNQTGVIRTETMEQFFHAARVLGSQPLPNGPRLAILTNAGGPAILSADRAEGEGLAVPGLSEGLRARLREVLPPTAVVGNPVDMTASATPEMYQHCLRLLLHSTEVDQVLVMFIPPLITTAQAASQAILSAHRETAHDKPLAACMLGERRDAEWLGELDAAGVTTFRFPEDAVLALAQLTRYRNWRVQPRGELVRFPHVNTQEARALIQARLEGREEGDPVWLPQEEALALMGHYGLPVLEPSVSSYDSGSEVETGRGDGQSGTLDAVIGMSTDGDFGAVLTISLAGPYLELFGDVSFALHPVTEDEALDMLRKLRAWPLFEGYQGAEPRDVPALCEVLMRLSQLLDDHPQIDQVQLSPVRVLARGQGCTLTQARVRVTPVDPYAEYVLSRIGL